MYKRGKYNYECLLDNLDAAYGGDRDKKKSLTCYVFMA